MESNKILNADLLDIIFEGKNKEYGAYNLRKTYNRRITIALTGMTMICLLFFLTRLWANDTDKEKNAVFVNDVSLRDLDKPKENKVEPKPVPPAKSNRPKVEIKKVTPFQIVKDIEVKDPPPAVNEIENAKIGLINQSGEKDPGFADAPVELHGTGTVEAPKKDEEDYEKTFVSVEKEAKFPGGLAAWKRYLERNLDAGVAADNGAKVGHYTVKVKFIVDKEGGISNVQAIEVPKDCPSCGPEAVKVIRKGPKWEPAIQNDRRVNYQAVQFITFEVAEE
jgi:protein TonB